MSSDNLSVKMYLIEIHDDDDDDGNEEKKDTNSCSTSYKTLVIQIQHFTEQRLKFAKLCHHCSVWLNSGWSYDPNFSAKIF